MNPVRKIIQKTGFDFHRHHPKPDIGRLWKKLGIKTVLDIGANVGQFAKEIRVKIPGARIYSFEPLKECFDELEINFFLDKNFKAFHLALGDIAEEVVMQKSAYTPSSSLLQMSETHKTLFPHTKEHVSEKIKIRRLDDLAEKLNLEKEILIKVDVQGFEDKVLAGGEKTFAQARAVIMETSFTELYENQPSFDTIYERLKLLGFKYGGSLQQKLDKHTGAIISEDSMFLK
jgi:FkbM family methyltransferase